MANLIRYHPFDDAIDDLFRGFFVRPVGFEGASGAAQFRVDVSENDNAYRLRAEIPGVKKDDINVSIDGDTVAISAEVKITGALRGAHQAAPGLRYIPARGRSSRPRSPSTLALAGPPRRRTPGPVGEERRHSRPGAVRAEGHAPGRDAPSRGRGGGLLRALERELPRERPGGPGAGPRAPREV